MLTAAVVARKELTDHMRDSRALISGTLYALMGPAIVSLLVMVAPSEARLGPALVVVAAVFTLASAFSGGIGVATDMIAGERERRSLLPLFLNCVPRAEIVLGKWLAVSAFAAGSLLATLLAFVCVFAIAPGLDPISRPALLLIPGLLFLALFAAALEVLVSTWCRNVKEANTCLNVLIFIVIGLGMWLAFSPESAQAWWFLVPIVGHEHLLQAALVGDQLLPLGTCVLSGVSTVAAILLLRYAARLFQRDAIVYGE